MKKAQWPLERVREELAKCELLCANCHRKLHYLSRWRYY
jgi:predicted HNH restriction endonuclease